MAEYTPNYGLPQWGPGDLLLHTDFNESFKKIDTAMKAAENKAVSGDKQVTATAQAAQKTADRALSGLEPLGYNLYNLLLRDYYEGLETDFRQALTLDGFLDKSRIADLTGVSWDEPNHSLLLDAVGQQQDSVAFGSSKTFTANSNSTVGLKWTATGNGTLTKVETYVTGTATLIISRDGQTLASQGFTQDAMKSIATLAVNVPVEAGVTYQIQVRAGNNGISVSVGNSSYNLGVRLSFTPRTATSGSMTSTTFSSGGTAQRGVLWVRHRSGTLTPSLQVGGSWYTMSKTSARTTVNLDGESCTESTFALDRSISGSLALKLALSTTSGTSVRIYDYGLLLL